MVSNTPVNEKFPVTRKLRDVVGKTIIVESVKEITTKAGKAGTVIVSNLGQFYATQNVANQLHETSDPRGSYLVVTFKPKVGDGMGIALRNLPPQ
jgi:hypothetical protein